MKASEDIEAYLSWLELLKGSNDKNFIREELMKVVRFGEKLGVFTVSDRGFGLSAEILAFFRDNKEAIVENARGSNLILTWLEEFLINKKVDELIKMNSYLDVMKLFFVFASAVEEMLRNEVRPQ